MTSAASGGRRQLALHDWPPHHGGMPRPPRLDAPGAMHHVVAKRCGGETIVRDDYDREVLLARLAQAVPKHDWSCHAYCLLDTHFHLVVATRSGNLGRGMQSLLAPYARDFNDRHERQGNLFHSRFYSKQITSDAQLTAAVIYLYLNPVRAGVVDRAELWPWSSYNATLGRAEVPAFLDADAVLDRFDTRGDVARLRLELGVRDALDRNRAGVGVRVSVSDTVSDTGQVR
jgi:putative transposase